MVEKGDIFGNLDIDLSNQDEANNSSESEDAADFDAADEASYSRKKKK